MSEHKTKFNHSGKLAIVKMIEKIDGAISQAVDEGYDLLNDDGKPDFGKISNSISLWCWTNGSAWPKTGEQEMLFEAALAAYKAEFAAEELSNSYMG